MSRTPLAAWMLVMCVSLSRCIAAPDAPEKDKAALYTWRADQTAHSGSVVSHLEALRSDENGAYRLFEWLAQVDGEQSFVIARFGDETPYLIVADGLAIWFDASHPDKVAYCTGIQYAAGVRLDPEKGLILNVVLESSKQGAQPASMTTDLTSCVRQLRDPDGHDITMSRCNIVQGNTICEVNWGIGNAIDVGVAPTLIAFRNDKGFECRVSTQVNQPLARSSRLTVALLETCVGRDHMVNETVEDVSKFQLPKEIAAPAAALPLLRRLDVLASTVVGQRSK